MANERIGRGRALIGRLSSRARQAAAARPARRFAVTVVATVFVAILALGALAAFAQDVDAAGIGTALASVDPLRLGGALFAAAASFIALTFYDFTAFRALGRPLPWRTVAPGAAMAFAISQTAGLGPLSGAAVRVRCYGALGVPPREAVKVAAFATLAFTLALPAFIAGAMLVSGEAAARLLSLDETLASAICLFVLALAASAVLIGGSRTMANRLPGPFASCRLRRLSLIQGAVTAADLAAASTLLWLLLPPGTISWVEFLPLFALALGLGFLSHAPGGLGVFELTVAAGLQGRAPPDAAAASLLLYRAIYHALPLAIALGALLAPAAGRALRGPTAAAALEAGKGLAPWFAAVAGSAALAAAGHAASASGMMIGAIACLAARRKLPLLPSLLASGVLVAAALSDGSTGRREGLALVLAAALAFSLLHRPSLRLTAAAGAPALALLVWLGSGAQAAELIRLGAPAEQAGPAAALLGGGAVALLAVATRRRRTVRFAPDDLALAEEIVARQPHAEARLALSGDKFFLFSEDGHGFVMYGRRGSTWLALHDPVGPPEVQRDLVRAFVKTARGAGAQAAFYLVRPESLPIYADAGMRFQKLGEQARVDLAAFDLSGRKRASHRNVLNRGARDGLSVEILAPGEAERNFHRLAAISQAWLASRRGREKGFSLGAFSREWVLSQRVAVLRLSGEIVAFATLMSTEEEAAVDLMRHAPDAPPAAMEFLFLKLCLLLREEGLRWFDLGMAPLSGLSDSDFAPIWHKLGRALYERGTRSYSFKGLRAFKAGLKPEWRSRYLAVSPETSVPRAMLTAVRLIHRGPEGPR